LVPAKRRLTAADILSLDAYLPVRSERRRQISELKRLRRVEVGPCATFHFENFETMRQQVQEMLYIEKGGDKQLADELEAYNPLIPQGTELSATVMFEIDDPVRRAETLGRLGGVENSPLSIHGPSVSETFPAAAATAARLPCSSCGIPQQRG